jgi:hypothetical protein
VVLGITQVATAQAADPVALEVEEIHILVLIILLGLEYNQHD